jgi:hypothetical protein
MTHVLIVSLGNSPEPIVNCINSLRPDRVVFFCSELSQKHVPGIVQSVLLRSFDQEHDLVVLRQDMGAILEGEVINELDRLDTVYERAFTMIQSVQSKAASSNQQIEITVDYTGGTKTMTAGLAMAAIDAGGIKLSLTSVDRSQGLPSLSGDGKASKLIEDLRSLAHDVFSLKEKSKECTSLARKAKEIAKTYDQKPNFVSDSIPVSTAAIHLRRLFAAELPSLLSKYDYNAANYAIGRVRRLPDRDRQASAQLSSLGFWTDAFDAWDAFNHRAASKYFDRLQKERSANQATVQSWQKQLQRILSSRAVVDPSPEARDWPRHLGHGFEAVEDLCLNALRRAEQTRFDDGVGRLYRAMELLAQIELKKTFRLSTSNIEIDLLPGDIQEGYRRKLANSGKKKLEIGLTDSFDLLAKLGNSMGMHWKEKRGELVNSLKTRNTSLFAHGFTTVDHKGWNGFWSVFGGFIQQEIDQIIHQSDTLPLQQLPSSVAELISEPVNLFATSN